MSLMPLSQFANTVYLVSGSANIKLWRNTTVEWVVQSIGNCTYWTVQLGYYMFYNFPDSMNRTAYSVFITLPGAIRLPATARSCYFDDFLRNAINEVGVGGDPNSRVFGLILRAWTGNPANVPDSAFQGGIAAIDIRSSSGKSNFCGNLKPIGCNSGAVIGCSGGANPLYQASSPTCTQSVANRQCTNFITYGTSSGTMHPNPAAPMAVQFGYSWDHHWLTNKKYNGLGEIIEHNNAGAWQFLNQDHFCPHSIRTWTDWQTVTEPTCLTNGQRMRSGECNACGDKTEQRENLPALGHDWSVWTVNSTNRYNIIDENQCQLERDEDRQCQRCGIVEHRIYQEAPTSHTFGTWTVTKEATCEENGSRSRTCSKCGYVATEVIPALGHDWQSWHKVDVDCVTNGIEMEQCSRCLDRRLVSETPALGHLYLENWYETKEATCIQAKEERQDCQRSGCTYSNAFITRTFDINPNNHNWEEWHEISPGCGEPGSRHRICQWCGKEETETIDALEHIWETTETINPTCTEFGYDVQTCTRCGDTRHTNLTEPTNHTFGEWFVSKIPNCDEFGEEKRICQNCEHFEIRETPKDIENGHDWGEWETDIEATCEDNELQRRKCKICKQIEVIGVPNSALGHDWNEELVEEVIDDSGNECEILREKFRVCKRCGFRESVGTPYQLGHLFVETEPEILATCGIRARTAKFECSRCGEIQGGEEHGDLIEHQYTWIEQQPTCEEDGFETESCVNCGHIKTHNVLPKLNHNFGHWLVVVEPTEFRAGKEERVCLLCGKTETRNIPRLPSTNSNMRRKSRMGLQELINQNYITCGDIVQCKSWGIKLRNKMSKFMEK